MNEFKAGRRVAALVAAVALTTAAAVLVIGPASSGATDGGDRPTPFGPTRSVERVAAAHAAGEATLNDAAPASDDVSALAVLTVSTTTDGGAGSLREAVETLAVNAGGDTVELQASQTYTLTCAAGGDLSHGNTPLTIDGNGAVITMAAGCNERLIHNGNGALTLENVQLNNVNITVGGVYAGGLVLTGGNLTLTGVIVSGNHIKAGGSTSLFQVGGGDTTTVNSTLVTDTIIDDANNTCGLFCTDAFHGTGLTVQNTTINAAGSGSCGIICSGDVTLTDSSITNSTFTDTAGNGSCGIFCSSDVTLTNSIVSGSTFHDGGGNCGIFCSGDVTMTNSAVDNSTFTDSGAVHNFGTCAVFCSDNVIMTDSRVTNVSTTEANTEADVCGGVFCSDDVTMLRSSVTGTRVSGPDICGGVFCSSDVTITNSTVADNQATSTAGSSSGVFEAQAVKFVYVTFVGNQSAGQPALDDIRSFTTFASVLNNSGPGGNCAVGLSVTSNGYNFADDTTCGLTATGDRQALGLDPLLLALADNGGPGPTMLPVTASPLVDAIPAAACQSDGAAGIVVDERSLPRPSVLSPNCDIGAVELQPVPIVIQPNFTG